MRLTDRGRARTTRRLARLVVLVAPIALAAGACAGGSDEGGSDHAAAAEVAPTTTAPTTTTTPEQALAAGVCPEVPARAEPDPDRPVYDASLSVDPSTGEVAGTVAITFTPDLPVDHLYLRLWANGPRPAASGTHAEIGEAAVDGRPVPVESDDPTLVLLPLDATHPAGRPMEVTLDYRLDVAGPARDRIAREGDILRLGSFLPLLPWVPGTGWATEPATSLFAEAATTPVADFHVGLAVPDGYDVLATGVDEGDGRWTAEAVRDFAASIGRFDVASAVVDLPEPVEVTVGVDRSVGEDPQAYLDRVVAALVDFSDRFGSYPWPSLSLAVTPGLGGGIEMPMHLMQGPETIGRTTPHEVAHMWFYALVGNNQAAHPWIDEGLASYAEATFEGSLDDMRAVSLPPVAHGRVDHPVRYWEQHPDDYYAGVYVQGAVAVGDLGDQAMVDCALRHYVADHAYGIADPADVVDALAFVFPHAPDALAARGVPTG